MTIERGRLDFNPGFQRDGVWTPSDRSLLIDSIVRNYPIPAIFLYKSQVGRDPVYYVLDGKQRLESILRFVGAMRGRFEALAEFPGAAARAERITWQTLNKREQQYRLLDYRMQIIEVEGEWSEVVGLFVRINSTGKPLKPQEIRNAKFLEKDFLREAKRLANRHTTYLREAGIMSGQQIRRMKHIELMCELIYAAHTKDVCEDCGKELDWGDFHMDHVKPHSRGGLTSIVNAALRCRHDNLKKGAKDQPRGKQRGQ